MLISRADESNALFVPIRSLLPNSLAEIGLKIRIARFPLSLFLFSFLPRPVQIRMARLLNEHPIQIIYGRPRDRHNNGKDDHDDGDVEADDTCRRYVKPVDRFSQPVLYIRI